MPQATGSRGPNVGGVCCRTPRCRRRGRAAPRCGSGRCRASNSHSSVAKKLSAIALAKQPPRLPIEASSPALRNRRPKARRVYWLLDPSGGLPLHLVVAAILPLRRLRSPMHCADDPSSPPGITSTSAKLHIGQVICEVASAGVIVLPSSTNVRLFDWQSRAGGRYSTRGRVAVGA